MAKIAPKDHFFTRKPHLASVIVCLAREIDSYMAVTALEILGRQRPLSQPTNHLGAASRYLVRPLRDCQLVNCCFYPS